MKRSELKSLTRRELYAMAKAYDIPGRSKMSKDELLDSLARVSAKKVMPKPKPPKRRMAKRRRRRTVKVKTTKPAPKRPSSTTTVRRPPVVAQPPVFVDRGPELPHEYGQDRITVMVRDPNWLYVYWDLSGGARDRLASVAAGGAWVLRVHNLDEGTHEDIPVLLDGGNWYLPVASDTEYQIDIGVIDSEGNFHLAASSRRVKTPPMGISDLVDEQWMILEDEFRRLMDLTGALSTRFAGSHFLSEIIARRRAFGVGHSAGVSSFGGSRR
ncbi:MAG: DUF4912 domain-containing protein [Planctomycetota bacterium]|jgi:hypothetical protein